MDSKMKNGDMPAMPITFTENMAKLMEHEKALSDWSKIFGGMSKLEEFTKAAMVAILSNPSMIDQCDDSSLDWVSKSALRMAKLQLKALEANNG